MWHTFLNSPGNSDLSLTTSELQRHFSLQMSKRYIEVGNLKFKVRRRQERIPYHIFGFIHVWNILHGLLLNLGMVLKYLTRG